MPFNRLLQQLQTLAMIKNNVGKNPMEAEKLMLICGTELVAGLIATQTP
jgi:hypothetical protein